MEEGLGMIRREDEQEALDSLWWVGGISWSALNILSPSFGSPDPWKSSIQTHLQTQGINREARVLIFSKANYNLTTQSNQGDSNSASKSSRPHPSMKLAPWFVDLYLSLLFKAANFSSILHRSPFDWSRRGRHNKEVKMSTVRTVIVCLLIGLMILGAAVPRADAGKGCPFYPDECKAHCLERQQCYYGYCGSFAWLECICRKCSPLWAHFHSIRANGTNGDLPPPPPQTSSEEMDSAEISQPFDLKPDAPNLNGIGDVDQSWANEWWDRYSINQWMYNSSSPFHPTISFVNIPSQLLDQPHPFINQSWSSYKSISNTSPHLWSIDFNYQFFLKKIKSSIK